MQSNDWSARRILRELCDTEHRREILACFLKNGDDMSRRLAVAQLAQSMRFREGSMRKLPLAKKAELLAARVSSADFEEFFEAALLAFHLAERKELMAAFLDAWAIPHEQGAIEVDDYEPPSRVQVEEALESLGEQFERRDLIVYLATAGLVMGDEGSKWRDATWSVVDASVTESSETA